jgi:hypothetical protein
MRNFSTTGFPFLSFQFGIAFSVAFLLFSPARAQEENNLPDDVSGQEFGEMQAQIGGEDGLENVQDSPNLTLEEQRANDSKRQQKADTDFDAVMQGNIGVNPHKSLKGFGGLGLLGGDALEPMSPAPAQRMDNMRRQAVPSRTAEPPVVVPLKDFADLRSKIKKIEEETSRQLAPAVVLGASAFSGEAIYGALSLSVTLQVTLGQPDRWKFVPLAGDEVVLVKATFNGQSIPVSRQSGYHVWVTRQTGEATLKMDILVPARGPRGSIEYDFLVARTPVTNFRCRFPVAGLEPRLDSAIQSTVRSEGQKTIYEATLRPTTRIHLVGYKELAEAGGQTAKVYAESLNLLSADEGALDLFSVIRYTILYAGTKEFTIQIPPGMTVLSADGEGAFRYTVEKTDTGNLLRGETAFPIRNSYEISMRLRRQMKKGGELFAAPLPRCQNVEREHGWLAVEVPGKLKLEEEKAQDVLSVDVRQLPAEMVSSAVSPILRAYQYHSADAQIRLVTTRLPEKEPTSGSVDQVRAFSQVSREGNLQTELHITLRNRLRHSLMLTSPKGSEVLSATLDGQPVKPSQDESGQIVLPLKRSTGQERLRPFTLQVSLKSKISSLGWFGNPKLSLPAVDLPVSSLVWSVYLPANNRYSTLKGDIEPQGHVGLGTWHQAPVVLYPESAALNSTGSISPVAGEAASANTGAMPVRMAIERSGIRLDYSRYWIESNHPIQVEFTYVRSWLFIPAWILLALLLAFGLLLFSSRFTTIPPIYTPGLGLALSVLVLWPLHKTGGCFAILLGLLLGVAAILFRRGWFSEFPKTCATWASTFSDRFLASWRERPKTNALALVWKILLTVGLLFCCWVLFELAIRGILFRSVSPLQRVMGALL